MIAIDFFQYFCLLSSLTRSGQGVEKTVEAQIYPVRFGPVTRLLVLNL